ncbi:MAG: histidine ammonia-lyase [Bacteroidales bacterium]|jgi:histidine ammonia-lyase|nr:histidine ammonia-lyase [Bacteroidales bacterium]MDD2264967.1 histidine ammonia-lyase [Bacteroidales bacterium]MDD2832135.1 histidine ammonia-lyase [Bacteroidales bacterium]MDD3208787.1 histidine ammonia-lyase [Bacteroidales bacterium]MDD3697350.1 histidine ammonia-lyase [Bacteroidales bacterium]
MHVHTVSSYPIGIDVLEKIITGETRLDLSAQSRQQISSCREYLDNRIRNSGDLIYGVNTGFGALYNVAVGNRELEQLQKNLVMSHACGMGPEVPKKIVRLMLFLKIRSLSYGFSGVQLKTVERLIDFFNNGVYPVVYEQGSLGASGDLAPLAHMALPLIGMGEVDLGGERISGEELNRRMGWDPINLQSKEGLALLNGTQFMCAYGLWCLIQARSLSRQADMICALSLDAYDGRLDPFTEEVHQIRPHVGQARTAGAIRKYLEGSELISRHKEHVQDPYSFRCTPQVHGATKDCMEYVTQVLTNEMNAATDNPTIFPKLNKIVSAGNFHGQPLALALDFLSIAIAELGSISERRINQLVLGKRGLPPFLVARPGLNSGFMIPQYTAASIVSQNKQLCTPSCVDSIDSSQAQEDHVSMGANSALKCYRVMDNVQRVLSIELFNAAQALEFRRPARTSPILENFVAAFRKYVPFIEDDTLMYPYMHKAESFLKNEWHID